jgi:hypothetical protein
MYGNDTYPDSRRIYSRPYACYFRYQKNGQASNNLSEFKESLHSLGERLIGGSFSTCCDMEKVQMQFLPGVFDKEKVVNLQQLRRMYNI